MLEKKKKKILNLSAIVKNDSSSAAGLSGALKEREKKSPPTLPKQNGNDCLCK